MNENYLKINTRFTFLVTIIHSDVRIVQPTTVQLHVHRIASASDHQMVPRIVFKAKFWDVTIKSLFICEIIKPVFYQFQFS